MFASDRDQLQNDQALYVVRLVAAKMNVKHMGSVSLDLVCPEKSLAAMVAPEKDTGENEGIWDFEQAYSLASLNLDLDDRGCPETSLDDRFIVHARLGHQVLSEGHVEDALGYYHFALQIKNQTIARSEPGIQAEYANILFNIGWIQASFPDKSIQAYDACLDLRKRCYGPEHPAVQSALCALLSVYMSIGDHETSSQLLEEALAIEWVLDSTSTRLFAFWAELGRIKLGMGLVDDATSCFEEAGSTLFSGRPPLTCEAMAYLSRCRHNMFVDVHELNESIAFFSTLKQADHDALKHGGKSQESTAPAA